MGELPVYSTTASMKVRMTDPSGGYMGVRVTYTGHIRNVVQTSVYRTTEENKRACLFAIAALEGLTYEEFLAAIEHDAAVKDYLKVELYRSS